MNHRHGHRWETNLKIRITCEEVPRLFPARLKNLSFNGAAVSLSGLHPKQGKMIRVQLPGITGSIPALVVHRQEDWAGLLWIERSAEVKKLLDKILMSQEGVGSEAYTDVALG